MSARISATPTPEHEHEPEPEPAVALVAARRATPAPRSTPAPKKTTRRKKPDPARAWARSLERKRPGLVDFVLHELAALYGTPRRDTRLDPVSELVLTILSQNTADVNSERAFQALRDAYPTEGPIATHRVTAPDGTEAPPEGWGGRGLDPGSAPDWDAVENAPLDELVEVIRPGGLAPQKAPRIQNALRHIREATGGTGHDLGFLATMEPRAARDWLTQVPGIGKKRHHNDCYGDAFKLVCFVNAVNDEHSREAAHQAGPAMQIENAAGIDTF